jgi:hypothetical protein
MLNRSWTRRLPSHSLGTVTTPTLHDSDARRPRRARCRERPKPGLSALARAGLEGSLTIPVDATPRATLGTVRHLDLTHHVNRALRALDLADRFPLAPTRLDPPRIRPVRIGCIWRIGGVDPGRRAGASEFDSFADPGHVKVCWAIDVEPAEEGTLLSITTRFTTTDEAAGGRLLDAWSIVGPLSDAISARAAHTIKAYTEDLEDGEEIGWP